MRSRSQAVKGRRDAPADTASGIKLRKRGERTDRQENVPNDTTSAPASGGVRLSISPKLLVAPSKRNDQKQDAKAGFQRFTQDDDAKRDAERIASGPAGQGRVASQKIRPKPQMIASGAKRSNRGRKPIPVVEKDGYSIYNVEASHLVDEFFTRKTDAIHFLEKDQKMPWSQIKHSGVFVPVKVKIIIDEKDLKAIGVK